MAGIDGPLYHHAGGAMLRAAALPLHCPPAQWPTLSDPDSCRCWLRQVWALPGFAEATRYASSSFATKVDAVLSRQITEGRQVRRVTLSVIRYLLRAVGRPTQFGLFAGVAPVHVGDEAQASWGVDHRALVRADTLWLDGVIEQLETSADLLPHLTVVISDLVVDRGDRIEMPRGPGRVTVRNTAVVRLVRDAAAAPISFTLLSGKIGEAFPAIPPATIHQALRSLVAQGVLITSLRPPMTVTNPFEFVIDVLDRVGADAGLIHLGATVEELRGIQRTVHTHNAAETGPAEKTRLRASLSQRMRRLSSAGRTTLAGDLHLDCDVTVPRRACR